MAKYREVVVLPLAARREALAVTGAILVILLLMGIRFAAQKTTTSEKILQGYQVKDILLKNQAPTLYRSLRGVVGDILDLHEDSGEWPDIGTLKDDALPPFAKQFLPAGLRGYVWTRHIGKSWVDYFGVNENVTDAKNKGLDPLENSFMLRIIDLDKGNNPSKTRKGGAEARFSCQVWTYPTMREYPSDQLIEKGWKLIVGSVDLANIPVR